ncbi:MAG TPA: flagellar basal body rod protein FlgB [Candidatus Jeotgalibaca merdavium]|uniref:Flagellar basal body rod protein FlgB n=1 Tax=Candidatus Jeotgalibaca merdavium TaxID=2838627 RepID=A0A9D2I1W2_9LACT|nr:flagellar basal body rod protein FlgB [Candidatus Jeotgalibaca merdavium]
MTNINFDLLKNSLDAVSLRQELIASNISNVNTEGYKANKLEFESLLKQAADGRSLQTTHASHLGGSSNLAEVNPILGKNTTTSVKENGNNVDIDMEMANQAQNTIQYQALTAQLNAQYRRLGTIING